MTNEQQGGGQQQGDQQQQAGQQQGGDQPVRMSPFFAIFLQQFLTYVVGHADEIVQALLELIQGNTDPQDDQVFEELKRNPSQENLSAAIERVTAKGVAQEQVADKLISVAKPQG